MRFGLVQLRAKAGEEGISCDRKGQKKRFRFGARCVPEDGNRVKRKLVRLACLSDKRRPIGGKDETS